MIEIRIHGRGGQGTVVASAVLASALFYDGRETTRIELLPSALSASWEESRPGMPGAHAQVSGDFRKRVGQGKGSPLSDPGFTWSHQQFDHEHLPCEDQSTRGY